MDRIDVWKERLMKCFVPEVKVEFKTVDGMFIKVIHLPSKGLYPQHSHAFDHSSLLARGSLLVWKGEEIRYYDAPSLIWIEKGVKHKFQTLEDETVVCCLHNLHGEEQIKVLEEHQLELEDL
jgi:quercetin dioxygenase-like cupin family protein